MYFKKLPFSFIFGLLLLAQQAIAEKQPIAIAGFKSDTDAVSYAVGASVGRNFRKDGYTVNRNTFIQGLDDGLSGSKLTMSEREFKKVLIDFQGEMRLKMAANQREKGIQNKKKEDDFLAVNAKKAGVVTLPSGVQYQIIKAGEGSRPVDADQVEVNYRGTLLDGTEFDGSLPDKPANLKLAQLIAGWKEAIKLMPVGSKWQLFIPAKQAYGDRGVGSDIGPNETLIFEVELLAIKKVS